MSNQIDALILGAGASGLMCALTAAARGRRVVLVDHAPRPGRKLLIAGGGKCNFTNLEAGPEDYVGDNPNFWRSALSRFSPWDFVAMLEKQAIPWEEREHGELFCTRSAADLLDMLSNRCFDNGCVFEMERTVSGATHKNGRFTLHTDQGDLTAKRLVIASGSPAWAQVGATDIGHRIARSFGHRIVPVRPALVPLIMPETWPLRGLQGISLPVSIATGGHAFLRDMLITHRGISGPATLLASCHWQPGQALTIDFLPGQDVAAACEAPEHRRQLVRTMIARLLPDRLAERLVPADIADRKTAELPRRDRLRLAAAIHDHTVTPTGTEGLRKAEVAAGGVDTVDVNPRSMESRILPGLHFSGEVLDVTGHLGGFNLHWAWASGKSAGESV